MWSRIEDAKQLLNVNVEKKQDEVAESCHVFAYFMFHASFILHPSSSYIANVRQTELECPCMDVLSVSPCSVVTHR